MKKFILTSLAVFVVCSSVALFGCTKNDGLEFACTDVTSAVSSGTNCEEKTLVIPNMYDRKPIIGIDEYAFVRNEKIQSVTFPEGITYIGAGAFYLCGELTEINIPSTLKSIGYVGFRYCKNLNAINYNGTKEQWYAVEKAYLWDCDTGEYIIKCTDGELTKVQNGNDLGTAGLVYSVNLLHKTCVLQSGLSAASADVSVPAKYYNYNIEEIGHNSFNGVNLKSVRLAEGILRIGDSAFENCASLKTIYLPSTLRNIGDSAFMNCFALTDIYYNGTREDWNSVSLDSFYQGPVNFTVHFTDDN